ncbi:MAG: glutathione S-transferase C-terminal domain-containing protein [Gammaproteobacteria bacterium]
MTIAIDDIKRHYVTIAEARRMDGLRIVLGAFTVPGPWHEACKGICHVKGLAYTPVRSANEGASDLQIGMGGSQSELVEWTAQSSAPVMVWNDERPRALWNDQLYLAERLQPEPSLIPAAPEDRALMFGLANELMGEGGLLFHKRHFMAGPFVDSLPADSPARALMSFLGQKYGYNETALARATGRVVEALNLVDAQLARQQARGRRYLVGDTLSALDIYWATSCGFLDPLPESLCPMVSDFRAPYLYGTPNAEIERALTPALRKHRDFVYERHLELPIVF